MKIIFLSDDFPPQSYGGAGIIAFNDAKTLVQNGHEVTVITATTHKEKIGETEIDGIVVKTVYSHYNPRFRHYMNLNNRKVVREVAQIIDDIKPDIVHAHNIHTYISYKSLFIASLKVPKVFLTAHDAMLVHYGKVYLSNYNQLVSELDLMRTFRLSYNPFKRYYIKKYLQHVQCIFAVSHALKNFLTVNGIPKVEILYNGIPTNEWGVDRLEVDAFKKKHDLLNKKTVLFSGRLSVLKGGEAVIKAFSLIVEKVPEARLLITGSAHASFEKIIQTTEEKVKSKIIMLPWVSRAEMKIVYGASLLVAVPSLYLDPFPTVNLEAMASSRPVIGTCFGGTPEAVVNCKNGFIIDPHNTREFADKLLELITNEEKAKEFGIAGKKRVEELFNIQEHITKLLSWYTNSSND